MNSNHRRGWPAQTRSNPFADKVCRARATTGPVSAFGLAAPKSDAGGFHLFSLSVDPDGLPRTLTGRLTGHSEHLPFKILNVFANLSAGPSNTANDCKELTGPSSRIHKLFKGGDGLTGKIPQYTPPLLTPRRLVAPKSDEGGSQTKAGWFKVQSSMFDVRPCALPGKSSVKVGKGCFYGPVKVGKG